MLIRTGLAAIVQLAFAAQIAGAAEIWDLSLEYQPNSLPGETSRVFADKLSELSGGAITVKVHYGAALGFKSVDQFDAVGDGALKIASSFVPTWSGINPLFLISTLPLLAQSTEDAARLYSAAKPAMSDVLDESNQVMLFVAPWPNNGIWAKKAIVDKASLKDLRIRTFDPNGTLTFRASGAAPIQLSWADVLAQLSTGGIEAVLTSADGGGAAKLWELLSHYTEIPYASPWQMVHMNKGVFDKLTEQEKTWVRTAAQEAEQFAWSAVTVRVERNYAEMREHGMTVVDKPDGEAVATLAEAGAELVARWEKSVGPAGKEILARYRNPSN